MDIEAIVEKYIRRNGWSFSHDGECADAIRAALTEAESCMAMEHNFKMLQVEANHAIELRAYEATVANLEQRIDELTGVQITVGDGLVVYGSVQAIHRVQAYILLDSKHPVEARDTNRYFAKRLQAAEQRIRQLSESHAIEMRAYEATVQNLEWRIRELEAQRVPGGFPSDVITAAGLVYHGKRDKVLAERLRIGAQSMLAAASKEEME